MRGLLILALLCCVSDTLSQVSQLLCPGGRIETRSSGKFCCYDKEEEVCYKIVSGQLLRDEEGGADVLDEDRRYLRRCPRRYPIRIGRRCCQYQYGARICLVGDEIADELLDEDRQAMTCNSTYPVKVDRWCCTQLALPRTCVGIKTTLSDEDEINADENRQIPMTCKAPHPVKDGKWCCTQMALPRTCVALKQNEEGVGDEVRHELRPCPKAHPHRIEHGQCCDKKEPQGRNCINFDEDRLGLLIRPILGRIFRRPLLGSGRKYRRRFRDEEDENDALDELDEFNDPKPKIRCPPNHDTISPTGQCCSAKGHCVAPLPPVKDEETRMICFAGFPFPGPIGQCCDKPFGPRMCMPARNAQRPTGILMDEDEFNDVAPVGDELGDELGFDELGDEEIRADELEDEDRRLIIGGIRRPLIGRPLIGRPLIGRPFIGRPLIGGSIMGGPGVIGGAGYPILRRRRCPWAYPFRVGFSCCTRPNYPRRCIVWDENDEEF